jgi:hypothetical protein
MWSCGQTQSFILICNFRFNFKIYIIFLPIILFVYILTHCYLIYLWCIIFYFDYLYMYLLGSMSLYFLSELLIRSLFCLIIYICIFWALYISLFILSELLFRLLFFVLIRWINILINWSMNKILIIKSFIIYIQIHYQTLPKEMRWFAFAEDTV